MTVDDDPAVLQRSPAICSRALRGGLPGLRRCRRRCGLRTSCGSLSEQERAGGHDRLRSAHAGDDRRRAAPRQATECAPDAKLVLLTAYADTDVAIRAINDIDLDHYLMKPWDPPEEKLYPVLDDLLERLAATTIADDPTASASSGIGGRDRSHEIKTFLARNYMPYRWLDLERDDEARRLHDAGRARRRPICRSSSSPKASRCAHRRTLDVADALGLRTSAEKPLYDLCIVGGGPAGLAAAVYGASEGLRPSSSRDTRPAVRPVRAQPSRTTSASRRASPVRTSRTGGGRRCGGSRPRWCSPVRWSGSRRAGRCGRCDSRTGPRSRPGRCSSRPACRTDGSKRPASVSSPGEACTTARAHRECAACEGDDVYVVGAANSAGQAVRQPRQATRDGSCARARRRRSRRSMSHYLVEQIRARRTSRCGCRPRSWPAPATNISRRSPSSIAATATKGDVDTNWLFVFIGAAPRTEWLGDEVARDDEGLRDDRHGPRLTARRSPQWPLDRQPLHARDERARRVRRRRRAPRFDEASRVGRRRRRDVRPPRAPIPGDDLMLADELAADLSCSTG